MPASVALLLCFSATAHGVVPLSDLNASSDRDSIATHFVDFLDTYGKADTYQEKASFENRMAIFSGNVGYINAYNKNSSHVKLGINQFADLTAAEFKAIYLSGLNMSGLPQVTEASTDWDASDAPDSIDWRTKGAVTAVKDQKACGGCWAFSTTGAIEGAWFLAGHPLVVLSEQELVDCSAGWRGGCAGGLPSAAMDWVKANGICSNASYPWTSFQDECHNQFNPCKLAARIQGYTAVQENNEQALKAAVAKQPISVLIQADTDVFRFYKSGVLKDPGCGTVFDHAVLTVGYGSEDGQDYWLVKNSWATTWGDEGYVKLARTNSASSAGECGIAQRPIYPVVGADAIVV